MGILVWNDKFNYPIHDKMNHDYSRGPLIYTMFYCKLKGNSFQDQKKQHAHQFHVFNATLTLLSSWSIEQGNKQRLQKEATKISNNTPPITLTYPHSNSNLKYSHDLTRSNIASIINKKRYQHREAILKIISLHDYLKEVTWPHYSQSFLGHMKCWKDTLYK